MSSPTSHRPGVALVSLPRGDFGVIVNSERDGPVLYAGDAALSSPFPVLGEAPRVLAAEDCFRRLEAMDDGADRWWFTLVAPDTGALELWWTPARAGIHTLERSKLQPQPQAQRAYQELESVAELRAAVASLVAAEPNRRKELATVLPASAISWFEQAGEGSLGVGVARKASALEALLARVVHAYEEVYRAMAGAPAQDGDPPTGTWEEIADVVVPRRSDGPHDWPKLFSAARASLSYLDALAGGLTPETMPPLDAICWVSSPRPQPRQLAFFFGPNVHLYGRTRLISAAFPQLSSSFHSDISAATATRGLLLVKNGAGVEFDPFDPGAPARSVGSVGQEIAALPGDLGAAPIAPTFLPDLWSAWRGSATLQGPWDGSGAGQTISAWFKLTSLSPAEQTLFHLSFGRDDHVALSTSPSARPAPTVHGCPEAPRLLITTSRQGQVKTQEPSDACLILGHWTHVALSRISGEHDWKLAINGQTVGPTAERDGSVEGCSRPADAVLRVGHGGIPPVLEPARRSEAGENLVFQGLIADVRVWDTARRGGAQVEDPWRMLSGWEPGLQQWRPLADQESWDRCGRLDSSPARVDRLDGILSAVTETLGEGTNRTPSASHTFTFDLGGLCLVSSVALTVPSAARPDTLSLADGFDRVFAVQSVNAVATRADFWAATVLTNDLHLTSRLTVRTFGNGEHWIPSMRVMGRRIGQRSGLAFAQVPAGERQIDQHIVELAPFMMSIKPVTNADFAQFMRAHPAYQTAARVEQARTRPHFPVSSVSWMDADAYCRWGGVSLPTRAQWMHACAAGTTTAYHSGDTEADLARAGWVAGNSDGRLHEVGLKEPNAFGLLDMHGLIRELCSDWHGTWPGGGLDATGPTAGTRKITMGGGYLSDPEGARTTALHQVDPAAGYADVGFRVVYPIRRVAGS